MTPRLAALALATVGALACPATSAAETGLAPPDPASPEAERIADIYWFILVLAAIVFFAVAIPLVVFVVRFRSRGRARDADGPQIHGSTRLELAWTAVPVLFLIATVAFVFYKLPGITNPAVAAGEQENRVLVEGRQFYWQFEYPNEVVSVNRLVLPAGRVTALDMTAAKGDVIHSFWVPTLFGKLDALPDGINTFEVRPLRPGRHRIVCGEFCGIQHAVMYGQVEVVTAAEYERWLEEQQQAQQQPSAEFGEATFEAACATCHGLQGEGLIGPPLAGNPIVEQAGAVEAVVRRGQNAMPAVGEGWSDVQMDSLIRYLRSELAPQEGGNGGDEG